MCRAQRANAKKGGGQECDEGHGAWVLTRQGHVAKTFDEAENEERAYRIAKTTTTKSKTFQPLVQNATTLLDTAGHHSKVIT